MAADIPTIEPVELFAGDSLAWTKSLANYPATDWTLTYRILAQAGASAVTLTASADGSDFLIEIDAENTSTWTAGEYRLIGFVTSTDTTQRVQIFNGPLTVKPDPATVTSYDGRSYLERILALLEKTIEEGIIRETIEYSYGGVHSKVQSLDDAFMARDYIKKALASEAAAAAAAAGQSTLVMTKFI